MTDPSPSRAPLVDEAAVPGEELAATGSPAPETVAEGSGQRAAVPPVLPLVDVAVPIPLPPLVYAVPPELAEAAMPGVRVRVRVGRRRLIGVVVGTRDEAPAGVDVRPVEAVIDREPVLPAELLELARFVADYYFAPLGEVLRGMLPTSLPAWGERKVWLTDAGALAPPRDDVEAAVVEALRGGERLHVGELARALASTVERETLLGAVDRLVADGRLARGETKRQSGVRYVSAVELAPGEREAHLETAGRSAPGQAVVALLAELGRPATVEEVVERVGCTPAVVQRLVKLGVLRRFTQVERLSLGRHMVEGEEAPPLVLRDDQAAALAPLVTAIRERRYAPHLLAGMTGSGKTEVYLQAVEAALAAGRGAVILVPEIALVPALARAAERRFGPRLAILHSNLASAERHQEWERIRRGEARVVLGPRSALFAPLADLGLVVVDEEQDSAYKQESVPRYHARDLALVRARSAGAAALLVSATPSLESRWNVERGRLAPLALTARAGQGRLPETVLVDLREEKARRRPGEVQFSEPLRDELARTFAAGEQAILLRNRRGYSPLLLCRACGEDFRCDQCGLPRTFHRRDGALLCHYCGSRLPLPARCPACREEALEPIGAGTERVEEDFTALFPGVPVAVLDRDSVRRAGGAAAVLERFARGEAQVLLGTQMVSKGHHFPRVALAAVLSADSYLGFPDFRAVERTYNLLVQLAGRAGRGDRPGRMVIQTFHPDHYAIRAATEHDDAAFAAEEMRFRRVFHYPPFTRMVQLLVRDRDRSRAAAFAGELHARLRASRLSEGVRIAGPAPAPLERLQGKWRFQLLVRTASAKRLKALVEEALPEKQTVDLTVDVDPYHLL
jgi:primosomal protein N' (replication factor Y) (superfamily II helicase)